MDSPIWSRIENAETVLFSNPDSLFLLSPRELPLLRSSGLIDRLARFGSNATVLAHLGWDEWSSLPLRQQCIYGRSQPTLRSISSSEETPNLGELSNADLALAYAPISDSFLDRYGTNSAEYQNALKRVRDGADLYTIAAPYRSPEVLKAAIDRDGRQLAQCSRYEQRQRVNTTALLSRDGMMIRFLKYAPTTAECQAATRQNPLALAFVPDFEQSRDIVISCIRRDHRAIHFVRTLHLDVLQSWIIAHPGMTNAELARWYPPWTLRETAELDSSVLDVHTAAIPHIQAFASIAMFTHYCGLPELDSTRFSNASVQTDEALETVEYTTFFDPFVESENNVDPYDWTTPVNRKRRRGDDDGRRPTKRLRTKEPVRRARRIKSAAVPGKLADIVEKGPRRPLTRIATGILAWTHISRWLPKYMLTV